MPALGSFVHTSYDGCVTATNISLDDTNVLVREVTVTVNSECKPCALSGQVSVEALTAQLEEYKKQNPAYLTGDSMDSILDKIKAANPGIPAAAAAAAASTTEWGGEDY